VTESVDFDHVLNICLERLRAGESLDDCLARYPSYAESLAPLLRTATTLHTSDGPNISRRGFDAGQARLMARASQLRHGRMGQQGVARRRTIAGILSGARRFVVATVAGLFLLCVVLGAGTVSAAAGSLPGSPLYPVKRATEAFVSSLAPTPELKVRAHLTWADRRLQEIESLVARDGLADEALLAALEQETSLALGVAEQAGIELLTDAVVHTERQQIVLGRVLEKAPPAAHPGLERALEASARGHARAQSALDRATSPGPPITPPGHSEDKRPSHQTQETPSAEDTSGTPSVPSDITDEVRPPGQGRGQGQDEAGDPNRDPEHGQGQDKAKNPNHGQGQDQNESEGSDHGQGSDKEIEKDAPGPPDKEKDKEQKGNPNPSGNSWQGKGGGQPDKPGQSKDNDK